MTAKFQPRYFHYCKRSPFWSAKDAAQEAFGYAIEPADGRRIAQSPGPWRARVEKRNSDSHLLTWCQCFGCPPNRCRCCLVRSQRYCQ